MPSRRKKSASNATAAEILAKASQLVSADRHQTHGDSLVNHQCIANLWNGYLRGRVASGNDTELAPTDIANMMELLKIARRLNGDFNVDDYVDGAGYSALAGKLAQR